MPRTFAKWYTLGSILLIISSMFLMGPWSQMKTMFHKSRAPATIVYMFSIIGTLYAALHVSVFQYNTIYSSIFDFWMFFFSYNELD